MSIKSRKYSLIYGSKHAVPFRKDRPLHILIAIYLAFFIALSFEPVNWFVWWYENVTSVIAVGILAVSYRKSRLTNLSYVCFLILFILHTVGAHYTYAACPIGDWMMGTLGFERNNYDRLVNFVFGLLISMPVMEVLYHRLRLRYIQACVLSVVIIVSICSVYDLVEMFSTMMLEAKQLSVFLGIKLDKWDSEMDIAMGLLGSFLAMGGCILFKIKKNHRIHMVKNHIN